MKEYQPVEAGEWIRPPMSGFRMECCDCGLVHTMNFRILKGRVIMQAFRNNRATGQRRRYRKTP